MQQPIKRSSVSKPRLSSLEIWNMNFGFFGIQFGWGLQMANMRISRGSGSPPL
jgi:hypothetical protein